MLEVAHDDRQKDFRAVGDVLDAGDRQAGRSSRREGTSLTGTPSGFTDLDEITGGFQPGNLIIIAARPSMGKSRSVTNIAENVALHHERPSRSRCSASRCREAELAQRFIASQASIKGDDLRKGRLRTSASGSASSSTPTASTRRRCTSTTPRTSGCSRSAPRPGACTSRRYAEYGGLGLIIIDYLQLMRADARDREPRPADRRDVPRAEDPRPRARGARSSRCRSSSRGVESRTDKRPMLSDLRESGQIEQDADLVMFIYRDEYYNRSTTERPGEADLIIAKHRNGASSATSRSPSRASTRAS